MTSDPRGLRALLATILLAGCSTRVSLHSVVLDYDETVSRAEAEMLLLNVARARHHRPAHFTTVSGIAATFEYQTSASLGGELAENPGIRILTPSLGVSVSESPTINIVPIQGEEFTRRLLTPIEESTFGFFYHQGVDPVLLLRLCGHGVILDDGGGRRATLNGAAPPANGDFETVAARLRDLDADGSLDVGPLVFEQTWPLAPGTEPSATDLAELIDKGYEIRRQPDALARRVVGRHAITNYDPAGLSNAEREDLHRRAQQYPNYFVMLDIRADPQHAEPIRGWIKLRSVSSTIAAIARGVRSADAPATPASPMDVVEVHSPPAGALFGVWYEGLHYSIPRDPESAAAFDVLYRMYQMTVAKMSGPAVPAVTIAK